MLGKLFITATSSPEKLQLVLEHVTEAIDLKVAGDAPSRNALTKLQSSLTKAIGEIEPIRKGVIKEETVPMDDYEGEVAGEEEAGLAVRGSEDETKMDVDPEETPETKDSILDELLDDEEEEL